MPPAEAKVSATSRPISPTSMFAVSLKREEAASNVISYNGLSGFFSLVMGCVFEFGICIKFLARTLKKAAPTKHFTTNKNDKHKVIKTGCKLEIKWV